MAQHDYVIDNASGATVRADINSALSAIQSLNSGTSEPSSTAAGMLWLDTTGGAPYVLKVRDAGNNHWLTLGNVTDPGADGNLELLPGKINLPSSGGIYESDGSTEILTESSGTVTLKNTVLDSSVSMASSGLTVRNIEQVALGSDQTVTNTTALTTLFSPTYTPKFANSKIQFVFTYALECRRSGNNDARKKFIINLSSADSGFTSFDWGYDSFMIGGYDYGASGIIVNFHGSVMGPLTNTTTTGLITASVKFGNTTASTENSSQLYGNNTTEETYMTWIEYK